MFFPLAVVGLYIVLWYIAPEKTIVAVQGSMSIFSHVILPICLVFLLMIGLNLVMKPTNVVRFLGKGTPVKMEMFAAVAGIIQSNNGGHRP